jgi:hypothetical protein
MNLRQHLVENLALYIVTAILIPAAWLGFMSIMDGRHEPKHRSTELVLESELRDVKREIRQQQTLQRLSPSETYGPYREAEIMALTDEAEEIERSLGKLKGGG